MCNVVVVVLLTFIGQASANDSRISALRWSREDMSQHPVPAAVPAVRGASVSQDSTEKLVHKLIDKLAYRALRAWPRYHADLGDITLGKPAIASIPGSGHGQFTLPRSHLPVTHFQILFPSNPHSWLAISSTSRTGAAMTWASKASGSVVTVPEGKVSCVPHDEISFDAFSPESITSASASMGSLGDNLRFDHVQFYVNSLHSLDEYKAFEQRLNAFAKNLGTDNITSRLEEGRRVWSSVAAPGEQLKEWTSFNRDLVRQLMVGAGFRVTGHFSGSATTTYEISSVESKGVRFIVTAKNFPDHEGDEAVECYSPGHIDRFLEAHSGKEGCGVLAFSAPSGSGTIDKIAESYQMHHPQLVLQPTPAVYENGDHRIFEVFAYYKDNGEADTGTVLRFIERKSDDVPILPGMMPVNAEYAVDAQDCRAFADHWVSNVHDRKGFLKTLEDTLGFTPKVDFNAGVVAAGEAIIESTVTGNTASKFTGDNVMEKALTNQDQVFLPINNALSQVGHVNMFLEQLGQGVQHIASRVPDLVKFIQRANNQREMLGEGFSFLRIPRSYYGRLLPEDIENAAGVSNAEATTAFHSVQGAGLVDMHGIVDLNVNDAALEEILSKVIADSAARHKAVAAVKLARYANLYKLLRDNLSEDMYLSIVRNQILIDIQGNDVLLQIFTAPVLQEKAGQEAPFFEFIQRICSTQEIKAGCGGFGIRNFLTLFLSIEVSKAMDDMDAALAKGDSDGATFAKKAIDIFESQLSASNPVLTMIADGMTMEGDARDVLAATSQGSAEYAAAQEASAKGAKMREEGNALLQSISDDHKNRMALLRQSRVCS